MADIVLRPYQRDFVNDVRKLFADKVKRVVGVAPCGAGKTVMTAYMVKQSLNRNKRTIFFVHRRELIAQTAKTFAQFDIPFGIIDSQMPMHLNLPVQIASVQTLARRIDKIPPPDFLICDECHHILANTYKTIINAFPTAYLLGVTATPQRMGGVNLGDVFQEMVQSLSVNDLINLGNLTKFRYFEPTEGVDLSNVKLVHGDYNLRDLADVMNNAAIIGDIVGEYKRLADGKSAICYCVDVDHSMEVAQAFNDAGIPAAHCDGNTPAIVRNKIVDDFRRGNIKILCNAELFGEGFDVPNMQAVILARPTQSLTLYIQQSMRPLRPDPNDPNKVAIIIDHAQNVKRHGLPNKSRKWSLEKRKPKGMRFCKTCNKLVKPVHHDDEPPENLYCPICGNLLGTSEGSPHDYSPRKKDSADGRLFEIQVSFDDGEKNKQPPTPTDTPVKPKRIRKNSPEYFLRLQGDKKIGWVAARAMEFATTFSDFVHIAKVCGYKIGWAWHKWDEFKKISKKVAENPPPC